MAARLAPAVETVGAGPGPRGPSAVGPGRRRAGVAQREEHGLGSVVAIRRAAPAPDAQAPWMAPNAVAVHASPAKKIRSATGSMSRDRQCAKPGRAAEYEPRAHGSPSHPVAVLRRIRRP